MIETQVWIRYRRGDGGKWKCSGVILAGTQCEAERFEKILLTAMPEADHDYTIKVVER